MKSDIFHEKVEKREKIQYIHHNYVSV